MKTVLMLALTVFALQSQAKIVTKTIEYKSGTDTFEGFVAYDDGKKSPQPGVLVVHDWMGITDRTKEKAKQLAELGYVAFAADIYGKGQRPANPQEAGGFAGKYKGNRKLYRERLNLALSELKKIKGVNENKLGAIGFCFGGTGVIELARSGAEVKGVVSFHGGLDSPTPADGKNIKGKVLALHGADDPFVPATDLAAFEDEMRKSNVDWQLTKYGGAVHSFTDKTAGMDNSKGAAYNEKADKKSFIAMKEFFQDIF